MEKPKQDFNYFVVLNKIECATEKKNNLTYVSWSDAWTKVKEQHPEATYTIYENAEWFPFWESKFGIDCKVGVTINWLEHIVRLPVMDWANKPQKAEAYTYKTKYGDKTCEAADAFDINKTIQRAFAKAIAMHGIGLYVYRGEDLPEEIDWNNAPISHDVSQIPSKTTKTPKLLAEYISEIKSEHDTNVIKTLQDEAKQGRLSEKQIAWLDKEVEARLNVLRNSPF